MGEHYSVSAVEAYLKNFTLRWYRSLISVAKQEGLFVLKEFIEKTYSKEKVYDAVNIELDDNSMHTD